LLTSEISSIESEINDSEMQFNYNKALKSQGEMLAVKVVLDESKKVASDIKNDFNVTKDLVYSLVNNVPENTYIVSMGYNNSSVDIECISDSYDSAAQFIHNIKKDNDNFKDVFMPYVNEDNGDYKYSLNVEIGGESNEIKQ
jgi:Tfp pilus assembly protein PilN